MTVRLLRVRHIGRPVVVVAIPQVDVAEWFAELGDWLALCRRAFTVTRVSPIPPYLRDDLGLPPDPLSRDRNGRRHHPVDPLTFHGWRQF